MLAKEKRILLILIVIATLLLVPFIAMQFTDEVAWDSSDFLIMGILLFSVGLLCEVILRNVKIPKNRILFYTILLILFFLVWAELAVGVFGTAFAGN